jgi:hypothetical protein
MQVAAREPTHVRELGPQIGREAVDDPGTPPLAVLAIADGPPDIPIQHQHWVFTTRVACTRAPRTCLLSWSNKSA